MTSTIYHTSSTERITASFKSIPYSNASIDFNSAKASTASFNSINKLTEGDKIRIEGDNHWNFGGQIIKRGAKLKDGAYSYECIDYTHLFFGKTTMTTPKDKTSYDILKEMLTKLGYSTAGLGKTTKKHAQLSWKAVTYWDIIQQLRWLDYKAGQLIECYVNADGTLIYKPLAQTHEGYIFKSAYDYSQEYDASDIITGVYVIKADDSNNVSYLSKVYDTDLMAVWGPIIDIEEGC